MWWRVRWAPHAHAHVHVCMSARICVCAHAHVRLCVHVCTCMHMWVYVCVHICVRVHTCAACVCVHVCVRARVCVCACVFKAVLVDSSQITECRGRQAVCGQKDWQPLWLPLHQFTEMKAGTVSAVGGLDLEELLTSAGFSPRAQVNWAPGSSGEASLQPLFYSAPDLELSRGHGQSWPPPPAPLLVTGPSVSSPPSLLLLF